MKPPKSSLPQRLLIAGAVALGILLLLLRLFTAAILIAVSMFTSGTVAIATLVLCGFFNSVMFPNIFTLGIAGLGPMTSKGSGLIMTAVVGGAIIPPLIGFLADKMGIQHSFIVPIICYLYIAYYGLSGSKPSRTVTA